MDVNRKPCRIQNKVGMIVYSGVPSLDVTHVYTQNEFCGWIKEVRRNVCFGYMGKTDSGVRI